LGVEVGEGNVMGWVLTGRRGGGGLRGVVRVFVVRGGVFDVCGVGVLGFIFIFM